MKVSMSCSMTLEKQGGGILALSKQESEILLRLMTAIKMPQSGLTVSQ